MDVLAQEWDISGLVTMGISESGDEPTWKHNYFVDWIGK